jgi:hypothetical protein
MEKKLIRYRLKDHQFIKNNKIIITSTPTGGAGDFFKDVWLKSLTTHDDLAGGSKFYSINNMVWSKK